MTNLVDVLQKIKENPVYIEGVRWGKPRSGHEEGTIESHIQDLEENLTILSSVKTIPEEDQHKLRILIHTHDTLKGLSVPKVPIDDPSSHASLAAYVLQRFVDDTDLIAMVQYHDEGYALYKQHRKQGHYNQSRMINLLQKIKDLELFMTFNAIDNCTKSKNTDSVRWFFAEVKKNKPDLDIDESWIDALSR